MQGVTLVVGSTVELRLQPTWPAGERRQATLMTADGVGMSRTSLDGARTWARTLPPGGYSVLVEGFRQPARFNVTPTSDLIVLGDR